MDLVNILKEMNSKRASDVILKAGSPVCMRINGELFKEGAILDEHDLEALSGEVITKGQKRIYKDRKENVVCFGVKDLGRFRATMFQQRGTPVIVIRAINTQVLTFEELNLPVKILENLCSEKRGLILITGTTGSGKSTTVASMIEYINKNMAKHIITLEDPIEFLFQDKRATISQREIRIDTESFQKALEYSMLQTPDVIFIGDIRTADIMAIALTTAETGQLVIANLHTISTSHTIERVVNFFQPHQHAEIRMQLSLLLKGIMSLRLVPLKDGAGRMPVTEVLIPTPTIVDLIREGKIHEIEYYIKDGGMYGMQTFNQVLLDLYRAEKITKETALDFAEKKDELIMGLKDLR
ncbi:MAG: type IV pili twitching motility protein PilT [Candidatus Omnitrophica bacterium CG02_land_8_20_14_3_00__42_8]|nr:MAG: type IV pili twitching motility protein PilT [Candidatus Omnitrophica bacterium CG02_land_8_20_14_3_00__42_8]